MIPLHNSSGNLHLGEGFGPTARLIKVRSNLRPCHPSPAKLSLSFGCRPIPPPEKSTLFVSELQLVHAPPSVDESVSESSPGSLLLFPDEVVADFLTKPPSTPNPLRLRPPAHFSDIADAREFGIGIGIGVGLALRPLISSGALPLSPPPPQPQPAPLPNIDPPHSLVPVLAPSYDDDAADGRVSTTSTVGPPGPTDGTFALAQYDSPTNAASADAWDDTAYHWLNTSHDAPHALESPPGTTSSSSSSSSALHRLSHPGPGPTSSSWTSTLLHCVDQSGTTSSSTSSSSTPLQHQVSHPITGTSSAAAVNPSPPPLGRTPHAPLPATTRRGELQSSASAPSPSAFTTPHTRVVSFQPLHQVNHAPGSSSSIFLGATSPSDRCHTEFRGDAETSNATFSTRGAPSAHTRYSSHHSCAAVGGNGLHCSSAAVGGNGVHHCSGVQVLSSHAASPRHPSPPSPSEFHRSLAASAAGPFSVDMTCHGTVRGNSGNGDHNNNSTLQWSVGAGDGGCGGAASLGCCGNSSAFNGGCGSSGGFSCGVLDPRYHHPLRGSAGVFSSGMHSSADVWQNGTCNSISNLHENAAMIAAGFSGVGMWRSDLCGSHPSCGSATVLCSEACGTVTGSLCRNDDDQFQTSFCDNDGGYGGGGGSNTILAIGHHFDDGQHASPLPLMHIFSSPPPPQPRAVSPRVSGPAPYSSHFASASYPKPHFETSGTNTNTITTSGASLRPSADPQATTTSTSSTSSYGSVKSSPSSYGPLPFSLCPPVVPLRVRTPPLPSSGVVRHRPSGVSQASGPSPSCPKTSPTFCGSDGSTFQSPTSAPGGASDGSSSFDVPCRLPHFLPQHSIPSPRCSPASRRGSDSHSVVDAEDPDDVLVSWTHTVAPRMTPPLRQGSSSGSASPPQPSRTGTPTCLQKPLVQRLELLEHEKQRQQQQQLQEEGAFDGECVDAPEQESHGLDDRAVGFDAAGITGGSGGSGFLSCGSPHFVSSVARGSECSTPQTRPVAALMVAHAHRGGSGGGVCGIHSNAFFSSGNEDGHDGQGAAGVAASSSYGSGGDASPAFADLLSASVRSVSASATVVAVGGCGSGGAADASQPRLHRGSTAALLLDAASHAPPSSRHYRRHRCTSPAKRDTKVSQPSNFPPPPRVPPPPPSLPSSGSVSTTSQTPSRSPSPPPTASSSSSPLPSRSSSSQSPSHSHSQTHSPSHSPSPSPPSSSQASSPPESQSCASHTLEFDRALGIRQASNPTDGAGSRAPSDHPSVGLKPREVLVGAAASGGSDVGGGGGSQSIGGRHRNGNGSTGRACDPTTLTATRGSASVDIPPVGHSHPRRTASLSSSVRALPHEPSIPPRQYHPSTRPGVDPSRVSAATTTTCDGDARTIPVSARGPWPSSDRQSPPPPFTQSPPPPAHPPPPPPPVLFPQPLVQPQYCFPPRYQRQRRISPPIPLEGTRPQPRGSLLEHTTTSAYSSGVRRVSGVSDCGSGSGGGGEGGCGACGSVLVPVPHPSAALPSSPPQRPRRESLLNVVKQQSRLVASGATSTGSSSGGGDGGPSRSGRGGDAGGGGGGPTPVLERVRRRVSSCHNADHGHHAHHHHHHHSHHSHTSNNDGAAASHLRRSHSSGKVSFRERHSCSVGYSTALASSTLPPSSSSSRGALAAAVTAAATAATAAASAVTALSMASALPRVNASVIDVLPPHHRTSPSSFLTHRMGASAAAAAGPHDVSITRQRVAVTSSPASDVPCGSLVFQSDDALPPTEMSMSQHHFSVLGPTSRIVLLPPQQRLPESPPPSTSSNIASTPFLRSQPLQSVVQSHPPPLPLLPPLPPLAAAGSPNTSSFSPFPSSVSMGGLSSSRGVRPSSIQMHGPQLPVELPPRAPSVASCVVTSPQLKSNDAHGVGVPASTPSTAPTDQFTAPSSTNCDTSSDSPPQLHVSVDRDPSTPPAPPPHSFASLATDSACGEDQSGTAVSLDGDFSARASVAGSSSFQLSRPQNAATRPNYGINREFREQWGPMRLVENAEEYDVETAGVDANVCSADAFLRPEDSLRRVATPDADASDDSCGRADGREVVPLPPPSTRWAWANPVPPSDYRDLASSTAPSPPPAIAVSPPQPLPSPPPPPTSMHRMAPFATTLSSFPRSPSHFPSSDAAVVTSAAVFHDQSRRLSGTAWRSSSPQPFPPTEFSHETFHSFHSVGPGTDVTCSRSTIHSEGRVNLAVGRVANTSVGLAHTSGGAIIYSADVEHTARSTTANTTANTNATGGTTDKSFRRTVRQQLRAHGIIQAGDDSSLASEADGLVGVGETAEPSDDGFDVAPVNSDDCASARPVSGVEPSAHLHALQDSSLPFHVGVGGEAVTRMSSTPSYCMLVDVGVTHSMPRRRVSTVAMHVTVGEVRHATSHSTSHDRSLPSHGITPPTTTAPTLKYSTTVGEFEQCATSMSVPPPAKPSDVSSSCELQWRDARVAARAAGVAPLPALRLLPHGGPDISLVDDIRTDKAGSVSRRIQQHTPISTSTAAAVATTTHDTYPPQQRSSLVVRHPSPRLCLAHESTSYRHSSVRTATTSTTNTTTTPTATTAAATSVFAASPDMSSTSSGVSLSVARAFVPTRDALFGGFLELSPAAVSPADLHSRVRIPADTFAACDDDNCGGSAAVMMPRLASLPCLGGGGAGGGGSGRGGGAGGGVLFPSTPRAASSSTAGSAGAASSCGCAPEPVRTSANVSGVVLEPRGACPSAGLVISDCVVVLPGSSFSATGQCTPSLRVGASGSRTGVQHEDHSLLSDGQRLQYNGVRVVEAWGAAAAAGISQGDIIVSVNSSRVSSVAAFGAALVATATAAGSAVFMTLVVRLWHPVPFQPPPPAALEGGVSCGVWSSVSLIVPVTASSAGGGPPAVAGTSSDSEISVGAGVGRPYGTEARVGTIIPVRRLYEPIEPNELHNPRCTRSTTPSPPLQFASPSPPRVSLVPATPLAEHQRQACLFTPSSAASHPEPLTLLRCHDVLRVSTDEPQMGSSLHDGLPRHAKVVSHSSLPLHQGGHQNQRAALHVSEPQLTLLVDGHRDYHEVSWERRTTAACTPATAAPNNGCLTSATSSSVYHHQVSSHTTVPAPAVADTSLTDDDLAPSSFSAPPVYLARMTLRRLPATTAASESGWEPTSGHVLCSGLQTAATVHGVSSGGGDCCGVHGATVHHDLFESHESLQSHSLTRRISFPLVDVHPAIESHGSVLSCENFVSTADPRA